MNEDMFTEDELRDVWIYLSSAHKRRNTNIDSWRRQYYAEELTREPIWEGGSSLQIPVTNWVVDLIHDRLFLSQFGAGTTYVQVKPRKLKDTEIAAALEQLIHFVYDEGDKRSPVSLAIRDAVLLGAGVVRIEHSKEMGMPVTRWVPLERFYTINPFEHDFGNAVAHVYYKQKRWLVRRLEEIGTDPEVIKKLWEAPSYTAGYEGNRPNVDFQSTPTAAPACLLRYEMLVDIFYKTKKTVYRAVYAPAIDTILEHKKYPVGMPFFVLRLTQTGYGEGLAPLLKPLEEEMSVLHNQRIDNNTLINLPILMVLTTSPALNPVNDNWFAGKKVPVDTPQDITPLHIAEKVTGYQDEAQLFDYIKLISGVSELLSGNPLRGEKTAYEVEATLVEGSVRFRRYVQFVADWMKRQALFEFKLLEKYGQPVATRLLGFNPFVGFEISEFPFLFIIQGNTVLTNKEMERQKWLLLRNLLSQEQFVVGDPSRWYEVLRQLLTAYDVDPRSIIGDPPEPPPPVPVGAEQGIPPELLQVLGGGGAGIPPELIQALGGAGMSPEAAMMGGVAPPSISGQITE